MAAVAGLRRWLAQILCPEAFKAEDQLDYIRVRLSELEQWCGYGFPEIAAAVDWIRRSERVYFMSLADYDAAVSKSQETGDWRATMVGGIDKFREEISDRFNRRPGI